METNGRELLENVTITSDENGSPQYMIQRMSVENAQLLSSELLQHNGIVVDLEGDFIPVNYTSEDLLPHDLTDEDRNLAAALVAVQFSQQQKQPPPQQDGSVIINTSLPSLVSTSGLDASKVTLGDQQVLLQHKQGYIQIVDAENLYKQTKFAQYEDSSSLLIKSEEDIEGGILHRDSDGDNREQRTAKKSLPHKKRISRKLKKGDKNSIRKLQKCTLCDQTFTLEEFAEHQELCQTTITPLPNVFACQLCNCSFADQLQFFEHLKVHYEPSAQEETTTVVETNIPTIQEEGLKLQQEPQKNTLLTTLLQLSCLECNKTFRRQRTYDQHIKDFHIKEDLNEFSEPEDLMAGIDVHPTEDDEDNKAWYQDELDATEEDLKELEAKEHVCQNCQQPFPIRAILLQHMATCTDTNTATKEVNVDVKKKKAKKAELECTICNRKFTHRNSLVYHLRSHTGHRPHQCEQCGKSFFTASALKVHLRLHSGDKPYRCEFCGRHFRQWGDLKYHCISIHSDQKQYQCEYCGKDFARKYSLIVHRRIHTGEKNYRCEFCGKTFRASSYLQNHRRIHTGEKPHPCEICGKRFRVRSDMKRHVRTHTRRRTTRRIALPSDLKLEDMPQESNVESSLKTTESDGTRRRCDTAIHGIHLTMSPNLKLEDLPQESDVESILKTAENDAAVQSLQYEQEALDTVRDGTLYVMPILIT